MAEAVVEHVLEVAGERVVIVQRQGVCGAEANKATFTEADVRKHQERADHLALVVAAYGKFEAMMPAEESRLRRAQAEMMWHRSMVMRLEALLGAGSVAAHEEVSA